MKHFFKSSFAFQILLSFFKEHVWHLNIKIDLKIKQVVLIIYAIVGKKKQKGVYTFSLSSGRMPEAFKWGGQASQVPSHQRPQVREFRASLVPCPAAPLTAAHMPLLFLPA